MNAKEKLNAGKSKCILFHFEIIFIFSLHILTGDYFIFTLVNFRSIVRLLDDKVLVFDPKESDQPFFFRGVKQRMRDITKKQNKEMQFLFDQVYGSSCTNEDVYNGSINCMLNSLLDGYNCSGKIVISIIDINLDDENIIE